MPRVCILSSVHTALDNRIFYREAHSLSSAGYEVSLIAVHPRDEVKNGITIRSLPRVSRLRRPLIWKRLLQMARDEQADVYHIQDPELLLVANLLRLQMKRPVIYDIHEANADFMLVKDYMPSWLRSLLACAFEKGEPWLAGRQDGLIFADNAIASSFAGFSGPKATLFNYPSKEFIRQANRDLEIPSEKGPVVLYLGGMERNRGATLMIQSFFKVLQHCPDAVLLLVGHFTPPSLEAEIKSLALQLGIERAVTVTGRVPFESVGRFLSSAAVGWVPWQPVSKNQKNIPTKLFEYLAYGLPVVCSDLDSIRNIVQEGTCGILVQPDDARVHAEAIVHLLQNTSIRKSMGERGRALVQEKYTWEHMEPRLLSLYDEVLGSWSEERG